MRDDEEGTTIMESNCLGVQFKERGGKHYPRLLEEYRGRIPIEQKYREGKMKRTLERE